MSSTSTRIALIRHGESRATVDRVVGGPRGCRGLTEPGLDQARAVAARLAATGELGTVTAVVTSALPRAIETGAVIAEALGVPTERDAAWNELEPGESDGLTWEEYSSRYPGFDPAADPFRPLAPGGESWSAFGLRVGAALHRLAADRSGQSVVVACHGGVVEQSMVAGLDMPRVVTGQRRLDSVPNTSITEWVVVQGPSGEQVWRLVRYADAAHLGRDGRPLRGPWGSPP